MTNNGVIIIGAGQAGQALATKLRNDGYSDPIKLIGEEPTPPYQRPPLSKAYLLGEMPLDRLQLRPEKYYEEADIELITGQQVTGIDRAAKTVTVGGQSLAYDNLALTTGARVINLPAAIGGTLDGVYTMRTLADADRIAPEFKEGARVLIVGGGYIGLEAAAVAAKKGLKVTLVEMADRILQRVASVETSSFFRSLHQAHGVDIREGVGLSKLSGDPRVTSATFSDGTSMDVDFVIVGVGISPNLALAEEAGLHIENGITTDAYSRTSDPDIYAAGDCASFPLNGAQMRLESVGNAIDQAEIAAQNIMGGEVSYQAKPWFWSDQYDVKLQIAGLSTGHDRVVTRKTETTQSHWYYKGDALIAIDAMNDPRGYMVAKRLIESGKTADPDLVADPETDLKLLMRG